MSGAYKPIEMDGPHGRFRIDMAGGKPELENAFLYQDDSHRFYFYAKLIPLPERRYEISVYYATTDRLQGPFPNVPIPDRDAIIDNIRLFFSKRNFAYIWDELSKPEHRPQQVTFPWILQP